MGACTSAAPAQDEGLAGGMGEAAFRALLWQAFRGETAAVLAAMDQDGRLIDRSNKNGNTLLHWASQKGQTELALALLERGASHCAKTAAGSDPLFLASTNGHLAVAELLLDRGADPNTSNSRMTALGIAAAHDHHDVCLLLLSRSANLKARMPQDGRTAWDMCEYKYPALSPAKVTARRAALLTAWEQGPHPSQVQRRKDVRWARRWPLMNVATGSRMLPMTGPRRRSFLERARNHLLFRRTNAATAAPAATAAAAAAAVDTACALPDVDRSTPAANRAYLQGQVLGNRDLLRQVAAFV